MSKTTTTTADLAALDEALASAERMRSTLVRMEARHRELMKARRKLFGSPPSLEEVLKSMREVVDAMTSKWRNVHRRRIVRALGGHWTSGLSNSGRVRERFERPDLPQFAPDRKLTIEDLAGLAPDLLKRSLEETICNNTHDFGPPAEERRAQLAAMDAELDQLERDHARLVDEAGKRGIGLEHMPEERARRERKREIEEARAREEEAYQRARREAAARGQDPDEVRRPTYVVA